MCLYTNNPEIHTATQDIVVYKVMHDDYKSLLQGFKYKKNTLYRLRKALEPTLGYDSFYEVDEGFHSYIEKVAADYTGVLSNNYIVVKCIIPKGAKYMRGLNGDRIPNYVSTSIKILEKI